MTGVSRALLALLLVALLAVPAGVGVVAAQEDGATTATPTSSSSANESTVVERVDEDLYVESYRYNATSQTFYVTLVNDGDRDSNGVTLTESISREDAGERKFGIAVVDVDAGETVTTSLSAQRVDGAAAVMILSEKAIESGEGTYLQESRQTDNRLIKGGAEGSHVRAGGLFGFSGTLIFVVLGAWQYVASKNNDVVDAELEPETTLLGRFK